MAYCYFKFVTALTSSIKGLARLWKFVIDFRIVGYVCCAKVSFPFFCMMIWTDMAMDPKYVDFSVRVF